MLFCSVRLPQCSRGKFSSSVLCHLADAAQMVHRSESIDSYEQGKKNIEQLDQHRLYPDVHLVAPVCEAIAGGKKGNRLCVYASIIYHDLKKMRERWQHGRTFERVEARAVPLMWKVPLHQSSSADFASRVSALPVHGATYPECQRSLVGMIDYVFQRSLPLSLSFFLSIISTSFRQINTNRSLSQSHLPLIRTHLLASRSSSPSIRVR